MTNPTLIQTIRDIKNLSKSIHRDSLTLFNASVQDKFLDDGLAISIQKQASELYELSQKIR